MRRYAFKLSFIVAIFVLIAARLVFVHSDPSDFPQDRNIAAFGQIRDALADYPISHLGPNTIRGITKTFPITPEFPFVRVVGWLAGSAGLDPVVSCRLFSLLMSLLTGLGIYILGRRISPSIGLLALWFFALAPMSVFMGRTLLPDSLMFAAVVWAFVAAGLGLPSAPRWAPVWIFVLFSIAGLSKLPALILVPIPAIVYLAASHWRGMAWLKIALSMLGVYLVICWWYALTPWNPFPGLQEMSSGTNNLFAATGIALSPRGLELTATRLVLALTWPGAVLALIGLMLAQSRTSHRVWLNTLAITSLIFVLITVGANTYWSATILPAGFLLAALACIELARFGRGAIATLIVASALILCVDPGVKKIGGYLAIQPRLSAIREAGRTRAGQGPSIFYGIDLNDVTCFVGGPGETWLTPPADLLSNRNWENFHFLYSTHMTGEPVMDQLFALKPVADTRYGQYIVFDIYKRTRLGTPVSATTGTLEKPIDLGSLQLRSLSANPVSPIAGSPLSINAVYSKISNAPVPALAIEFIHESGEVLPLVPISGGAQFNRWSLPRVQTPDFTTSGPEQMRYDYKLPKLMPAGAYAARVMMLDPASATPLENGIDVPLNLSIKPQPTVAVPYEINLADGVWLNPTCTYGPAWFGRSHCTWALQGDARLWLSPPLQSGKYRLAIRGRGDYVGINPLTRWPILEVHQPNRNTQKIEFDSTLARTHEVTLDWRGPGDVVRLRIANPQFDYAARQPFALYPHELTDGSRMIEFLDIQILPE